MGLAAVERVPRVCRTCATAKECRQKCATPIGMTPRHTFRIGTRLGRTCAIAASAVNRHQDPYGRHHRHLRVAGGGYLRAVLTRGGGPRG